MLKGHVVRLERGSTTCPGLRKRIRTEWWYYGATKAWVLRLGISLTLFHAPAKCHAVVGGSATTRATFRTEHCGAHSTPLGRLGVIPTVWSGST